MCPVGRSGTAIANLQELVVAEARSYLLYIHSFAADPAFVGSMRSLYGVQFLMKSCSLTPISFPTSTSFRKCSPAITRLNPTRSASLSRESVYMGTTSARHFE